jgi:AhpD family alkylhydroperoxidase
MKTRALVVVVLAIGLVPALAAAKGDKPDKPAATAVPPATQKAYDEIAKAMGSVPSFIKLLPENAIPATWEEMKTVQMNPKSAIPGKYKELIGLAVAAQIPCAYCVYGHTEFAKLNGATDKEIKETVAEAALTREWSTILNGYMQDEAEFRKEVDVVVTHLKRQAAANAKPADIQVVDMDSALKDMKQLLGIIPSFMKELPKDSVAAAWNAWKADMDPSNAVPAKYKDLMSLAIAAQIPCRYCLIFDTEFARLDGATDDEIHEAVMMSALTRKFSTVLNGHRPDEAAFRREIDGIVKFVKKSMPAAK